jgi:hypothetical protein
MQSYDSSNRTYTLDEERLGFAIDVLKRAAQSSALTRREWIAYRALIISGDLAVLTLLMTFIAGFLIGFTAGVTQGVLEVLAVVSGILLWVSAIGGTLSLLLNVPLFLRTFRERAELKKLGLTTLSKSLWKAGRKHRWLPRIRGALLLGFGSVYIFSPAGLMALSNVAEVDRLILVLTTIVGVLVGIIMLAARYLRNQREQTELVANAEELQKALRELQQQAGDGSAILVPAEILERVAGIESTQIAQDRKSAILASVSSPQRGYAVSFAPAAAEQKSALAIPDRIELEDLVERLSAGILHSGPDARSAGALNRARTASAPVEIEYTTDEPRRKILVRVVRRIGDAADRNPGPERQSHA